MSASLRWDGLTELRIALRNLPAELTAEAAHLVEATANQAVLEIKSAYPVRTGNLRDGVEMSMQAPNQFAAVARVINTAHLAWIFEYGSAARHYYTKQTGAEHLTGAMPPGHVFVPIMERRRRGMYDQLAALLERNGLQVKGDVAA
jgi:hypothetical protein